MTFRRRSGRKSKHATPTKKSFSRQWKKFSELSLRFSRSSQSKCFRTLLQTRCRARDAHGRRATCLVPQPLHAICVSILSFRNFCAKSVPKPMSTVSTSALHLRQFPTRFCTLSLLAGTSPFLSAWLSLNVSFNSVSHGLMTRVSHMCVGRGSLTSRGMRGCVPAIHALFTWHRSCIDLSTKKQSQTN